MKTIISNTTIMCFQENVYINNIKNVNNIEMLYYNRIDVSEGIDVTKGSPSKEYYFSLLVSFK